MAEIIPAVLPKNYDDLKNKISLVRGVVPFVQVDLCDGVFVPHLTWPFLAPASDENFLQNNLDIHFHKILNDEEGMPCWDAVSFELDLMVHDAVQNFDIYTKLGPKRVVFHIEAVGDVSEFRDFLEGIDTYIKDGIEIGVAVSPTAPVETVFPVMSYVDFVQVMGIDHEGIQGEDFDPKCLEHIKTLKERFPSVTISVDGAVSLKTAPELVAAGADRLVIGSAIFNSDDIVNTLEKFRAL